MYIQKELIQIINNYYYKNIKEKNKYFPINYETDIDLIKIKEIEVYISDLRNIKNNNFNNIKSNEVLKLIDNKSKIENKIKLNILNLDKVTINFIEILKELKEETYIVGGFLRDLISDKSPKDIDFCSENSYKTLENLFENKKEWKIKKTGKQFLVLNVCHISGKTFEIAELRSDKDNKGGITGDIISDSFRRDFYINSLFYSLQNKNIIDPTGNGIKDNLNKEINFIGNGKQRIIEDPNRVFRFYRMIKKGFKPGKKSLKLVRENFEYAISNTSSERIRNELEKIVNLY